MFSLHLKELEKQVPMKKGKSPRPLKVPDPSPSPRTKATMKRVKSRDNFIKFQWPWIL